MTIEDVAPVVNEFAGSGFPADAEERLREVAGIRNAGTLWTVRLDPGTTIGVLPTGGRATTGTATGTITGTPVVAASPGAVAALVPTLREGRLYDEFAERSRQRVVLIGSGGAERLGISTLSTRPPLCIGEEPFTVAGVIADVERKPENLLAGICLVIGAVGIANTTLVAVLERTSEIGLRRALGARGRHVAAQFLTEAATLGTLGGLVGTSLGELTVVAVSLARDWTPVIHPATVAAAPLTGLVTGLPAGLHPAWRAARIEPVEALRR
nr:ABC transporter permease [Streptomyces sp. H27-H5]